MKPISTARISRLSIFLAERKNYTARVSQGLWNAEPWQTYPDGSGRSYKRAASRQERQAARLDLRTLSQEA